MPRTWWGKAIVYLYLAGYALFLLAAGISAWPHLTFTQWWAYMAWQSAYAVLWPVWLVSGLPGLASR